MYEETAYDEWSLYQPNPPRTGDMIQRHLIASFWGINRYGTSLLMCGVLEGDGVVSYSL